MTENKRGSGERGFESRRGDTQPSIKIPGASYEKPNPSPWNPPADFHSPKEQIKAARFKALSRAEYAKAQMREAQRAAYKSRPKKAGWFDKVTNLSGRAAKYSWRKTKAGAGVGWNDLTHTNLRMIDRMGKWSKEIGYGISDFFTGIQNWGHKKLNSKGLKWMAHIPLFGRLIKAKPEKTWRERDEAAEKKRIKNAKSKKKKKKDKKELTDLGLTGDQADALLKAKEDDKKDDNKKDSKGGDKKDDAPKDNKKDDKK